MYFIIINIFYFIKSVLKNLVLLNVIKFKETVITKMVINGQCVNLKL